MLHLHTTGIFRSVLKKYNLKSDFHGVDVKLIGNMVKMDFRGDFYLL